MTSPAKRKAAQRARERALGLVYVTVRVPEQDAEKIKRLAAKLCAESMGPEPGAQ